MSLPYRPATWEGRVRHIPRFAANVPSNGNSGRVPKTPEQSPIALAKHLIALILVITHASKIILQLCIRVQDASSGQLVAVWRDLDLFDRNTTYSCIETNRTT
jgi:hypothetical protein